LWLRFLSEINDLQEGISPDFLDVPELKEASELILESGLTKGNQRLMTDIGIISVQKKRRYFNSNRAFRKGYRRFVIVLVNIIKLSDN
jgi:hypothetical protein